MKTRITQQAQLTVEEDDLHIPHSAERHTESSLHASGVRAGEVLGAVEQLYLLQYLVHRLQCSRVEPSLIHYINIICIYIYIYIYM